MASSPLLIPEALTTCSRPPGSTRATWKTIQSSPPSTKVRVKPRNRAGPGTGAQAEALRVLAAVGADDGPSFWVISRQLLEGGSVAPTSRHPSRKAGARLGWESGGNGSTSFLGQMRLRRRLGVFPSPHALPCPGESHPQLLVRRAGHGRPRATCGEGASAEAEPLMHDLLPVSQSTRPCCSPQQHRQGRIHGLHATHVPATHTNTSKIHE